MTLAVTSCIQEEPLNDECDIEAIKVLVDNPDQFFFHATDAEKAVLSTDSVIIFSVRSHADLKALALNMTITEGATMVPASGSIQDFSHGPVLYTVTSQDGRWQRRYWISFVPTSVTVSDTLKIDFENYELDSKGSYYVWYQPEQVGTSTTDWATGNAGFKLSRSSALPDEYPTMPEANGYDGAALHLKTRDTGSLGSRIGKPIAAGNFYLGEFDLSIALLSPLKATRFGKPFNRRPVKMSGYYKYTPGPTFIDKNKKPIPGRTDVGSIYAVFYRNHDAQGNSVMLFGDDVQTNPNIVAIAKVGDIHATTQWTPFEVEFSYNSDVDLELLEEYGYNFTIVFSSSVDGDMFEGAIDSEMYVDKVRVVCTHQE
ncbi:MAG: PCMD domain-containing protein [Muribaculaceae bacterium]|nr:PCMD domain-containing protein [Muribaculaceae bacterium]